MSISTKKWTVIKTAGTSGILAFAVFCFALIVFGSLNQEFSFSNDFISKLGAKGEPFAVWWNMTGFVLVGLLLIVFGISYGKILNDQIVGILLSMFGLGFALISIPMDLRESDAPVSKAHVMAVCLALAFWLFGLARMGYSHSLEKKVRLRANLSAALLASFVIGFVLGFWSMPMTHRLVLGVVFGWTVITCIDLLLKNRIRESQA